ncbi:uncharacterized protein LOC122245574, partial [Penaeus japonicus]|uniref:uncharacterized protein LOC122245574 n=1 Tax=Penaeus japonicus TaxID=27405 RepID=UPI001C70D047
MRNLVRLLTSYKPITSQYPRYPSPRWVLLHHQEAVIRSRTMSTANVKWLKPADREAWSFHVAHEYGTRMGIYGVTINSSQCLKEEDICHALRHLRRKFSSLRIGFQRRGDTLWYCEPEDDGLDFK